MDTIRFSVGQYPAYAPPEQNILGGAVFLVCGDREEGGRQIEIDVGVKDQSGPIAVRLWDSEDAPPRGVAGMNFNNLWNLLDGWTKLVEQQTRDGKIDVDKLPKEI